MSACKYDPPDNEPRLVAADGWVHAVEAGADRAPPTDDRLQLVALAIADRVHGPEIARLRAAEAEFAKMRDGTFSTLVARDELERLRGVEETYLDLVKRLREVIIHTLSDCKAANLALTDRFAIEVFDEASIALGLPISNEDGVPFELLPPASAVPFKPIIRNESYSGESYHDGPVTSIVLQWSPREQDITEYADFDAAMADFGERYATWKESQR